MKRIASFIFGPVVAALLLVACGQQGTFYEKSPDEVVAALRSAHLPLALIGQEDGSSRVRANDDGTVSTIIVNARGEDMLQLVTTIIPEGTGSRVSMALRPPEGRHAERVAQALSSNDYARSMMSRLADEHLAAAMEGRRFDLTFASPPMARAMLNATPEMRNEIDRANRAMESASTMSRQLDAMERQNDMREDVEAMQRAANLNRSSENY